MTVKEYYVEIIVFAVFHILAIVAISVNLATFFDDTNNNIGLITTVVSLVTLVAVFAMHTIAYIINKDTSQPNGFLHFLDFLEYVFITVYIFITVAFIIIEYAYAGIDRADIRMYKYMAIMIITTVSLIVYPFVKKILN